MTRHLLVTNDFPPKVGGIQNYLWELWRRLPPDDVVVHTTPYEGAGAFDAAQPFTVTRSREPWLLPGPHLTRRVRRLARRHDVDLVVIDPALPAGLIGPHLDCPYAVIVHGAEAAIPGRLPGTRALLGRVLDGAVGVIAAGGYVARECERALDRPLPAFVIPPGVDVDRFEPQTPAQQVRARKQLELQPGVPTVVSVSRLVPRKGMDTLIRAASLLAGVHNDLQVVIAGKGRDRRRLTRLAAGLGAPVQLRGRLSDDDLTLLYGCADVFAMLCRTRWRGLEQEGFGIVFLEAAAAGVPQVAGRSGGAHEAVADGATGIVLDPTTPESAAAAIGALLDDPGRRKEMGDAARRRAETGFSYDVLAGQLRDALDTMVVG
ncbi:MAG: glycosyltransferase family 4 protein [Acidimicrobiaceae bacterium]|nr:glycosyltransferase family 4 protein [Acidimicrobiaceae bacterium]